MFPNEINAGWWTKCCGEMQKKDWRCKGTISQTSIMPIFNTDWLEKETTSIFVFKYLVTGHLTNLFFGRIEEIFRASSLAILCSDVGFTTLQDCLSQEPNLRYDRNFFDHSNRSSQQWTMVVNWGRTVWSKVYITINLRKLGSLGLSKWQQLR